MHFNKREQMQMLKHLKCQSYYHRDPSQLICSANQLTGFYMMATLAVNELNVFNAEIFQCSKAFLASNNCPKLFSLKK